MYIIHTHIKIFKYKHQYLCVCIIIHIYFSNAGSRINSSLPKLTVIPIIYAIIFLWSSYMQFKTNLILAKLRKNEHGDVVSYKYSVPVDGLFKYISAPLQFTEILIYLMLSGILWQACTYHYVTIWVISNQVLKIILYISFFFFDV